MGLARRGYMLGMDHINRGLKPDAQVSWQRRAECIKKRRLIPWLKENGVSDRAIRSITVDNPGRFFGVNRTLPTPRDQST